MKRGVVIAVISAFLILVLAGFLMINKSTFNKGAFGCSELQLGEWQPKQGECQNQEMQQKCDEFCSKYPSCCPGWQPRGEAGNYGQTILPLPSTEQIASLSRSYPATIKAINEGPLIYSKSEKQAVISDEKLEKIKESGFNTIQIMLIGKWDNDKIIFNEANNAVLLNDIVTIKKKGIAVWVALSMAGGPPVPGVSLGESYEKFKPAYLYLVGISSELMEQYKVEYLTVNNEPDKYFEEQTKWGSKEQVDTDLADFFVSTNALAVQKFQGKIINKLTQPKKRAQSVISASLQNADIAGIDVGPPISESMTIEKYKEHFEDYQFYADAAAAKGIQWMNAEYWQGDFEAVYSQFTKEHQREYLEVSFDAYLAAVPTGGGYTYNDFSTFSLQPNGELTKQAIKAFFEKI
ncbi:MAG: hypothetical protein V1886_04115 [archaeon]